MKNNLTIFYTDDDVVDQEIFEEIILSINKDISLRLFESGEELINALNTASIQPDLLLIDLNMPGKNGFDVLLDLQQLNKKNLPPVIIFTTSSSEMHKHEANKLGATLFIEKPRHYETFVKTLHSIISTALS